jgi:hypothetical protein
MTNEFTGANDKPAGSLDRGGFLKHGAVTIVRLLQFSS